MTKHEARKLVREILVNGVVFFSGHARKRMAERKISEADVRNILRGGWVEPGEWENGSWRYRVCTQRMEVVVTFAAETKLVVVTVVRRL